jgi:O-antigen/teichoic acid export membrane protein
MTLSDTIRGSRRLLGDLRDVSLNSIIIALLSLLFHLVLSRKLGPVQYGELDTILTINMIILISVAAVSFIIARFVSYYKTRQQYDQMKYLVYWAFTLFLIAGVLSCTATIIFSKDIG